MKLAIAAASAAVLVVAMAAPAMAADSSNMSWYTNLGYSDAQFSDANLNAVNGRIGVRGTHIGVEVEAATGLGSTDVSGVSFKMRDQYAADVVAFLPIEHGDLFARAGYGRIDISAAGLGHGGESGWNAGVGGQWFPRGGSNGVRVDYTYNSARSNEHFNNYGISWVHKF